MMNGHIQIRQWVWVIVLGLWAGDPHAAAAAQANAGRWWKGNLHTHSLWSDGDDYPEMIVKWYKENGYHFLTLSDHNVLSAGDKWIEATTNRAGAGVLDRYAKHYGTNWVEQRRENGKLMVRLKPLAEFRTLFEEPGKFLLMQSEEITDRYQSAPVHVNATNLRDFIAPQGGQSVFEVMQNNVQAVLEQRRRTGQPMFPHLNHPNFGWAITAEDLMQVDGERFFEVYNGHPAVHNEGDATHAGAERMWDIILTWRLALLNLEPILGIAVDDAHNYQTNDATKSNPGRGWVVVRAPFLTPEHIVRSMEAGDFYASSGVRLRTIERAENHLALTVAPEPGVRYRIQFIGTRKSFDRQHQPLRSPSGDELRVTHQYSDEIGIVLAETTGVNAAYQLKGDELYVRAKIISSKPKSNPYAPGEVEIAWIQPIAPPKN